MAEVNGETLAKRNDSILQSDIMGETVMFCVENGKYYGLSHIETEIWKLLENEVKVSDICTSLRARYDVSEEQCLNEVMTFISDLMDHELVNKLN